MIVTSQSFDRFSNGVSMKYNNEAVNIFKVWQCLVIFKLHDAVESKG